MAIHIICTHSLFNFFFLNHNLLFLSAQFLPHFHYLFLLGRSDAPTGELLTFLEDNLLCGWNFPDQKLEEIVVEFAAPFHVEFLYHVSNKFIASIVD